MPQQLERELMSNARKLARKGKLRRKNGMSLQEAENNYVYGTLHKIERASQKKGNKAGKYLPNTM